MKRARAYPEFRHRNTASAMNAAKGKQRTSLGLDDWTKENYAHRPEVLERLTEVESPLECVVESGEDARIAQLIAGNRPCLIKGGCAGWRAMKENRWSLEELYRKYKHVEFKIGEDDHGRKIRTKFKYFHDYMLHNEDDSPLYLFESGLDYAVEHSWLREDYEIPECFPCDWLNLCGREHKPPSLWFCVGPQRSGTTVHKDPLGTSAWNAVTSGRKRWVLFEPTVAEKIATGKSVRMKGEDKEAINYFDVLLPRIKREYEAKVYEFVQEAGDIIFVPGGWWHGVVNLQHSVAVTHNYCGPENFDKVVVRMSRDRPGLCRRWTRNMKRWRPQLYRRAKWLSRHGEDLFPHDDTSSDSDDTSEYSSSDEEEDIDWTGCDLRLASRLTLDEI